MENLISYKWQILSALEFVIILYLSIKLKWAKKSVDPIEIQLKKEKKNEVDMGNLMKDLHLSKDLYRELSRKYHPDRFVGTPLVEKANDLFQLIQKNKNNYHQLQELKNRATLELNMNQNSN